MENRTQPKLWSGEYYDSDNLEDDKKPDPENVAWSKDCQ